MGHCHKSCQLFGQKYDSVGNGVYTFKYVWYVILNVSIRWGQGCIIFPKFKSHPTFLVAGRVTWSRFHTEHPQMVGSAVVTWVTWFLRFMCLWVEVFVQECTHFTCQCHYIGGIILKWKSVKWNSICTWKYSLVETQHLVIVPCHIRQLQGGYSHSNTEKCWLLTHITVDSVYIHTVAIFEQCIDEGRHWVEGISSWTCRVLWVYSASNFMTTILLKWVPLHLNQVEEWVHYATCRYQSGTVLLWRGLVILNNCDWWTWTRACEYEPEPKWQPQSSTFRMKTQDLTNSIIHKSDDHFGMQHPRCCVSSSCTGPSCQWKALHNISAVELHVAVREKCPDLFENSSIVYYNATTHSVDTVKNAGQHWGWKVLWYFPCSLEFSSSEYNLFPELKHMLRA